MYDEKSEIYITLFSISHLSFTIRNDTIILFNSEKMSNRDYLTISYTCSLFLILFLYFYTYYGLWDFYFINAILELTKP